VTGDEALSALTATVEQLREIVPANKAVWDAEPVVRLAVERLSITAGNVAEEYRRSVGIEAGVEPWAGLAAYRNRLAHALPGDLSTDRIWSDTTADPGSHPGGGGRGGRRLTGQGVPSGPMQQSRPGAALGVIFAKARNAVEAPRRVGSCANI
jgi:hypothetical protein